ncbi:MAG: TRAP transporter substrate-binding protein [Pseudomonadota bacterium]|nr:TRAP transporter substrate-binding protein [Pseudomonadota bacterium]
MKIRRSLAFIGAGFAVASTLGLAPSLAAAQATLTLRAADVQPAGYPDVVAIEHMGHKLEAATNGRIKLKMFPGGVLGSEKEEIEQTQVGAIDILRASLGPLGPVVPDVNVFNMPFVFRNEAHMRAVIDGPIGDAMLAKITASPAKLVALGWMDSGSRSLYTKKPVRSIADLKGMKIRMIGNPLFVDTMNAMGGNGISMGYGEVFSALQTGVIDGAENNPPSYYTANHFAAGAKYYTLTNHLIIPEIFVMSKVTWDKLGPEDKVLVKKFSREAQFEQRKLWDESVTEYVAKLKAAGVEFIPIDNKPFYDATAGVRAKYGAPYADLIKQIEATK